MNKLYSVHDHWTDINKKNDVDIESIDGVITGIKVNGEDYGGSDLSTATVTLINETMFGLTLAHIDNTSGIEPEMGQSGEYEVVLYKGKAVGVFTSPRGHLTVTGNITYDDDDGVLFITGDGSITINLAQV